jgi:STE like transcription factor
MKKFEEGIFSDLRNLKPGVDASLEEPKVSFFFTFLTVMADFFVIVRLVAGISFSVPCKLRFDERVAFLHFGTRQVGGKRRVVQAYFFQRRSILYNPPPSLGYPHKTEITSIPVESMLRHCLYLKPITSLLYLL